MCFRAWRFKSSPGHQLKKQAKRFPVRYVACTPINDPGNLQGRKVVNISAVRVVRLDGVINCISVKNTKILLPVKVVIVLSWSANTSQGYVDCVKQKTHEYLPFITSIRTARIIRLKTLLGFAIIAISWYTIMSPIGLNSWRLWCNG